MMLRITFWKWTKNYAIFRYDGAKSGVVYIPREMLKDEINRDSHLIFHSPKQVSK